MIKRKINLYPGLDGGVFGFGSELGNTITIMSDQNNLKA